MKEVNNMPYDSAKVARERAIRDKISLVLILLIGIGMVIYAVILQKQEIAEDMQEYEDLSQMVQHTADIAGFPAEKAEEYREDIRQDEPAEKKIDTAFPNMEPEETFEQHSVPQVGEGDGDGDIRADAETIGQTTAETAVNEPCTMSESGAQPPENTKSPVKEATSQPVETEQPATGKTGADLAACKAANTDFIAWLKIPDTKINYPVVLTDNVDYYLTHTFTGKQSKIGTLFSLSRTDYETPGQSIAVYGHHITTGGGNMFQPLLSYKKQSFWEKHKTVYFDTLYDFGEYTVFAVFNMTLGEWDVAAASFADDLAFQAFLTRAQAASLYDTGVAVSVQDHILTLITCDRSYHGKDGRFVVMAVKR